MLWLRKVPICLKGGFATKRNHFFCVFYNWFKYVEIELVISYFITGFNALINNYDFMHIKMQNFLFGENRVSSVLVYYIRKHSCIELILLIN